MNGFPLLYLSCILAGFALIKAPITGFLEPVEPLTYIVGVLAILVFSVVILINGLSMLFGKGRKL